MNIGAAIVISLIGASFIVGYGAAARKQVKHYQVPVGSALDKALQERCEWMGYFKNGGKE